MIKVIRNLSYFCPVRLQCISFSPEKEIASCHAMFISRKTTWLSLKNICVSVFTSYRDTEIPVILFS